MSVFTDQLRNLTPTQKGVWGMLSAYPDGVCRRDFAEVDIWEVSNRISEIEARLGVSIIRDKCERHGHRNPVVLYRI